MFKRAALRTRKDCQIEQLAHGPQVSLRILYAPGIFEVVAQHDDASTGSAQRLMSGRSDDMAMFEGIIQEALRDETCGMCDVGHYHRADLIGHLANAFVVPVAAIGRRAANDHLR